MIFSSRVGSLLFGIVLGIAPSVFGANTCQNCNVLLISIDSLRADRMSLYGYQRPTTPEIEKWAADARVYENFIAASFVTPISEAAVHSGQFPMINGVQTFESEYAPQVKTMAEYFAQSGYETFAVGNSPEFAQNLSLKKNFSRGFDHYWIFPRSERELRFDKVQSALDIARTAKKPFFLWVPMGMVHAPFGHRAPNKFADPNYLGPFREIRFQANMQYYFDGIIYRIRGMADFFSSFGYPLAVMDYIVKTPVKRHVTQQAARPEDMNYISDQYDNGVNHADTQVGRLLDHLRHAGLMENTIVILEGEHGESLGEDKYIAHYDIREHTTHTPLIIRSPKIAKHERIKTPVSGVDILPTLLTHVKIDFSGAQFDGVDLFGQPFQSSDDRPVFLTRTPLWETRIKTAEPGNIFERFQALDDKGRFKDFGVRDKRYKMIYRPSRFVEEMHSCWTYISGKKVKRPEYEFYDLQEDPKETRDLGLNHPKAKEYKDLLMKFVADMKKRENVTKTKAIREDYL